MAPLLEIVGEAMLERHFHVLDNKVKVENKGSQNQRTSTMEVRLKSFTGNPVAE